MICSCLKHDVYLVGNIWYSKKSKKLFKKVSWSNMYVFPDAACRRLRQLRHIQFSRARGVSFPTLPTHLSWRSTLPVWRQCWTIPRNYKTNLQGSRQVRDCFIEISLTSENCQMVIEIYIMCNKCYYYEFPAARAVLNNTWRCAGWFQMAHLSWTANKKIASKILS